jgi:hypothetical protein
MGTAMVIACAAVPVRTAQAVDIEASGYTTLGEWSVRATVSPSSWKPGERVTFAVTLKVSDEHVRALSKIAVLDGFAMLITAERTFDGDGNLRLGSDERMSTLVTPTGLAIEGGVQGAVSPRFNGYGFRTPVDALLRVPVNKAERWGDQWYVSFRHEEVLGNDLPPGIYRVRLDFGSTSGANRYLSLNGESFAYRPFPTDIPCETHVYTPPIPASAKHVDGRSIDASRIQPRVPWTILANYNSNGYQGVVADEDQRRFALSSRNIISDDVILPRFDSSGRILAYTLEPQFPADTIDLRSNIPWDFAAGEYSVQVVGPDGKSSDLGTYPFAGKVGQWPTTKKTAITQWRPNAYGYHTVTAKGWIKDIWGNRYEGGGTYHFWIANRMTMATATFQGMPYPVGNRYGREMAFNPPLPADVEVTATLYPDSDRSKAQTLNYKGKASMAGIFGAVQGMQTLSFTAAGEYHARVLAKAWDKQGHFWVSSMRHAGIVYSPDTNLVARGKKLQVGTKYLERGDTNTEGYDDPTKGERRLEHINYPFNAGDVLLIASEGTGANKIEPVLSYDFKDKPLVYDTKMQGIGLTNVKLETSNGLSPHMFPEYITAWNYFYGAAPRPGFMSRFLVADNGTRAPYWPTSATSFGGQINASSNGDITGDIYRLIGGVVLRRANEKPQYAGYLASAFILPGGSKNNRIIEAGTEDLPGPAGLKSKLFLVGIRPGSMFEVGSTFAPAVQIDPILPAYITFTLDYPDGRRKMATGTGDASGSFAGVERWTLDVPGIYRYHLEGTWNGARAVMPGLPPDGGFLYVVEKDKPESAPELKLNLPLESYFNAEVGLNIAGTSTADSVCYAAIIPGSVIDQGEIPVVNGKFAYFWDPKLANQRSQTYDIVNRATKLPAIGDVVHLTFFSKEKAASGKPYHSFHRVVIRGTKVVSTR